VISIVSVRIDMALSLKRRFEDEIAEMNKADVLKIRRKHFSAAQSISYANTDPLLIVRGKGARLYDDQGREFLDTRNNVCHVGHAHPRVAEAVSQQVSVLNTNTRYLHPNISLLAQRLVATFPKGSGLEVCFFVNSGSEANDLALRLAYAQGQSRDVICVQHAYHGHTNEVLKISPFPRHHGGQDMEPGIHKVTCPDTFRGEHRGEDAGLLYAKDVVDACGKAGGSVAAFIAESSISVGGAVMLPPGYLRECYRAVRAAGGICIADEVQVGFGRFGRHFWAFEQQGVHPDVVTMGKPFGNGMPLAAVVTTREVAAAFQKGHEYFNTFGGNPVCCAAGLAVMDVLVAERLQENATNVGDYFKDRLNCIGDKHAMLGDVRGAGLFIGIDFVRNRDTREPATEETSEICSRMKEEHLILTSIDGPHENVLMIKPPMCFSRVDVDQVVDALDKILSTLQPRASTPNWSQRVQTIALNRTPT